MAGKYLNCLNMLYLLAVRRWLSVKQQRGFARFASFILLAIGVAGAAYSLRALTGI